MNRELHSFLDGEIPRESLPEDLQSEAAAWQALLEDVRDAGSDAAPVGLETRVLQSVRAEASSSAWVRAMRWWTRPRPLRLPPLAGALAAAAVVLLLLGRQAVVPGPGEVATGLSGQAIHVQFALNAPDASTVAISGDFTDWSTVGLSDADGDGVWTVRIPVKPGVHEYMFLIDGTKWITDPNAERYEEDGYGYRNAVVAVAPPTAGI
jgi:hypothetical protein